MTWSFGFFEYYYCFVNKSKSSTVVIDSKKCFFNPKSIQFYYNYDHKL